ncbi:Lrp/AsnC family transcriptional regulator [Halomonas sp. MCCC 1A17488]|uniref:Lrp/AsnC family transcriptional regulator n=1 Tax=Billgrantia sulfidoxydans TaxID=2733484 RepID=A0ABX7W728_9GAMM|nr:MULTISPECIES: Lrp/AsnC family transcriptional regulator [Halomonas]MCE8014492.1 Lrp/AsnC family transcriptional regulator [Halomonas sp. MCCC 1A17488]MCG3237825.1 Lrp/AsnC family transcriptional regulator [Halomonas sp. MCCC 1A17488]QPP48381.1 Lrp/AsnC family transcriptional regulator [Halomonas sp. SS10-MC5]QTP55691.1 Lrp/AsnC family transcriptional regulator [Halomonas sulfidoxydans]
MRNLKLDRIDRMLLEALQQDARLTTAEMAELVSLSPSPCARRIRRLEQAGLITRYRAELDKVRLGLTITLFVQVRLDQHQQERVEAFEESVRDMPEVIQCHSVSGHFDYLLQVITADLGASEQWLRQFRQLKMVSAVDSSFAIRAVKENGPLPLPAS